MSKTLNYDDNHIYTMDPLEHIRSRPAMYIGSIGSQGVYRLFLEAIGNSIDEYNNSNGICTTIYITIDCRTNEFIIEDNGRGIPLGKLKSACMDPRTSGKFNNDVYKFSIGQNGVGLKCINALSKQFEVTVKRDHKKSTIVFKNGGKIDVDQVTEDFKYESTGTCIKYIPDPTVLKNFTIDLKLYEKLLKLISCVNKGIVIKYVGIDKNGKSSSITFYSEEGISQYLKEELLPKYKPVTYPIVFENYSTNMCINVAFAICSNTRKPIIESYVNGIATANGGYHVQAVVKGLFQVIQKEAKSRKMYADIINYLSIDDLEESLVAIISANHNNPLFDGQTKDRFSSEDFFQYGKDVIISEFEKWITKNKDDFSIILDTIMLNSKARYEASKARNLIKSTAMINSSLGLSDPKKYKDCTCKDPKLRELHIVEGESAGGSVAQAKDNQYQALYKLKGKPLNAYSIKDIEDELTDKKTKKPTVIGDLVKILGCGIGKTFNINNLQFNKIIIDTDADPDGYHIRALLIAFFFKYMRPLIDNDHIYVNNPPLYKLTYGNIKLYAIDKKQYYMLLDYIIMKLFNFKLYHNNKLYDLNIEKTKVFLYYLRGYHEMLDSISEQTGVHPIILEHIVSRYEELNGSEFTIGYYKLNITDTDDGKVLDGMFMNKYYRVIIDDFMLKTICKPISKTLSKIHYKNIIAISKDNKLILGPTLYMIDKTIKTFITTKMKITRYKGLGEMNPSELWESVLDPKRRMLTKVVIDELDDETYERIMNLLCGDDIELRKEYYRKYK